MSSPSLAFGQKVGSFTSASLDVASSWSCGQRLTSPFTNPVACAITGTPLLLKSAIFTSQPQPDQAVPVSPLTSFQGAWPAFILARSSLSSLAVFMYWLLLSWMPQGVVMLLTNMSYMPSLFRSPKSTPMPLNESLPTRLDFGTPGVRTPITFANFTWPGVDWLYSNRSTPKSLAMYSSGSRSPSRSVALEPSV